MLANTEYHGYYSKDRDLCKDYCFKSLAFRHFHLSWVWFFIFINSFYYSHFYIVQN